MTGIEAVLGSVLQALENVESRHGRRERDVEEDGVRTVGEGGTQRTFPICRFDRDESRRSQLEDEDLEDVRLVVDDENPPSAEVPGSPPLVSSLPGSEKKDHRHRFPSAVGDRDVRGGDSEDVGAGPGPTCEDEPRRACRFARDGDLAERDPLHPRSEGFHRRLLRGEEACDVLADPSRFEGAPQLARGADPVEEPSPVAAERLLDPVDLAEVDSEPQDVTAVGIGGGEKCGAEEDASVVIRACPSSRGAPGWRGRGGGLRARPRIHGRNSTRGAVRTRPEPEGRPGGSRAGSTGPGRGKDPPPGSRSRERSAMPCWSGSRTSRHCRGRTRRGTPLRVSSRT